LNEIFLMADHHSPTEVSSPVTPDISQCEREPIHIPGSIQPYGVLLALDEKLTVTQASRNTQSVWNREASQILGEPLKNLLDENTLEAVVKCRDGATRGEASLDDSPQHVAVVKIGQSDFHLLLHRRFGVLVLELEPLHSDALVSLHDLYAVALHSLSRLESATDIESLCQAAADEVARVSGFDKVMVYQFDADWNGIVIAESKTEQFESYLGLRFPASDIPAQARQLYLLNRLRIIPDANYQPVPIVPVLNPQTGAPLDLSFSFLRSVSPVHVEYLKNMGVTASMSVSVVLNGQLWGLIACHNATPKYLSFETRSVCELLGQTLALQIAAKTGLRELEARSHLRGLHLQFLEAMARHTNPIEGLREVENDLLQFVSASGAALSYGGEMFTLGSAPQPEEVQRLASWLMRQSEFVENKVFATSELPQKYRAAQKFGDKASGLLAISISEVYNSYVMWFRPEETQVVNWAGDPKKPVAPSAIAPGGGYRLHPRKSFELWQETVRGKSQPWQNFEVEAVNELRLAIINIVLRKAEETAALSEELQRTNKELEAFSYSVSHDLRAPFRHITGYAEMLSTRLGDTLDATSRRYLETVISSAQYAGTLVDNLLAFSQMGRAEMSRGEVSMNALLTQVLHDLEAETQGRRIAWSISDLPPVQGDAEMLRLVWRNLLSNAVKYSQPRENAQIEVGCMRHERENVFFVRDNGVGFDMNYVGKLFGVFQRLHGVEEFQGTGIGLANVRRIVMRHGGRAWAEGEVGKGATFYFALPTLEAMKRFEHHRGVSLSGSDDAPDE
jgi:two-component system, chemotaxis family, sensor kinase Cph1